MISAKIVADSIETISNNRLTTLQVTMPRYILAEFNTHRMLSKNSASSRAIPFKKMVKSVRENPFIPIAWQKDHKGMQGIEYIKDKHTISGCNLIWLDARDEAIKSAQALNSSLNGDIPVTKQLCNRLLEPFMYHTVLVSGTEWENFFNLRCPQYSFKALSTGKETFYKSKKDLFKDYPDSNMDYATDLDWLKINQGQADIHIMAVAEAIWDAMNESTPKVLQPGEWHIPFGDNIQFEEVYPFDGETNFINNQNRIKIATARCARLSYQTLGEDPKIDYEADIKLHDILLKSGHYSPFEHCARAMTKEEFVSYTHTIHKTNLVLSDKECGLRQDEVLVDDFIINRQENYGWCRNYRGFIQYRELIDN